MIAYKDHNVELYQLSPEDLLAFMTDVDKVASVIAKLYNPAKINYGAYSDKLPHLHIHLAPKYVDGTDYGSTFVMNPQKVYLTDSEYTEMIDSIKKELKS